MMNSKSLVNTALCFLLTSVTVLADERDEWQLLFRPGILDTDITYGEFIKCLETAEFPLDPEPRKASSLLISEGVKVTVNKETIKFFTSSGNGAVLITSVSIGGNTFSSLGEKIRFVALFFEACPMMIERRQEQEKQEQAEREQYEREVQERQEKARIEWEQAEKERELKRAEERRKRQEEIEQQQARAAQKQREINEWLEAHEKSQREKFGRTNNEQARKRQERVEEKRKRHEEIEPRQARESQKKREIDELVDAYDKSLRENLDRVHDMKARKQKRIDREQEQDKQERKNSEHSNQELTDQVDRVFDVLENLIK